jgi:hypothetical protein
MKRVIYILFMLALSLTSTAENVYISIAIPSHNILDSNSKTILKNKIISMVTAEGISATEYSAIAMIPEISILSNERIEGGMRNIIALELSVQITIRNIITNNIFNSIQLSVKGNGFSVDEAQRAAISSINASSPEYTTFIKETKDRIINYYKDNTSLLISKAKTFAAQQQYDEAIALLATYPEFLSDYTKVSTTIKEIFKKGQTHYCSQLLQSARASYANRDFEGAAEIVSYIDASSSCAIEAKNLLLSIKKNQDAVYNNEITLQKEYLKSKERIATATINAARDVAKAYFKRQTTYVYLW